MTYSASMTYEGLGRDVIYFLFQVVSRICSRLLQAKEACETGLRLEPDHPKLEAMRIVAEANEASEVTARVVRFKQSRHTARPEQVGRPAHTSKAVGNTRLLSFGEAEAL